MIGIALIGDRSEAVVAHRAIPVSEEYHCSYGLNPSFEARLNDGPLRVSARDGEGSVRGVEPEGHPFYVATLFQPERAALRGQIPPLVRAFVAAAR